MAFLIMVVFLKRGYMKKGGGGKGDRMRHLYSRMVHNVYCRTAVAYYRKLCNDKTDAIFEAIEHDLP